MFLDDVSHCHLRIYFFAFSLTSPGSLSWCSWSCSQVSGSGVRLSLCKQTILFVLQSNLEPLHKIYLIPEATKIPIVTRETEIWRKWIIYENELFKSATFGSKLNGYFVWIFLPCPIIYWSGNRKKLHLRRRYVGHCCTSACQRVKFLLSSSVKSENDSSPSVIDHNDRRAKPKCME